MIACHQLRRSSCPLTPTRRQVNIRGGYHWVARFAVNCKLSVLRQMSKVKLCDTAKLPGGRCRFGLSPCSTSRIIICRRKNVSRHRTPRGARRRRVRCDAAEQGDRFRILAVVNDLSREPGAGGRWRRARHTPPGRYDRRSGASSAPESQSTSWATA